MKIDTNDILNEHRTNLLWSGRTKKSEPIPSRYRTKKGEPLPNDYAILSYNLDDKEYEDKGRFINHV